MTKRKRHNPEFKARVAPEATERPYSAKADLL